eukprot:scaffold1999_cov36-Attheya_sp.AAC.7
MMSVSAKGGSSGCDWSCGTYGKLTVVKVISGMQTVQFKNELEQNITIKLGYANAKIYKGDPMAGAAT